MASELERLKSEAVAALDAYYADLDRFYTTHLKDACDLAVQNVTDVRLKQIEADLKSLTARLNKSPSFGLFLLDLALLFLPIVSGHLLERGLKHIANEGFRGMLVNQRRWQLLKLEVLASHPAAQREFKEIKRQLKISTPGAWTVELNPEFAKEIYEVYRAKYALLTSSRRASLAPRRSQLEKSIEEAATMDYRSSHFEFATPVINDAFQAVGAKLLGLSGAPTLAGFANQVEPKPIKEYEAIVQQRFADSPNALLKFIVGDICRRQIDINRSAKQCAKFLIELLPNEPFLAMEREFYKLQRDSLPSGSALSEFVLVMSEMFEAAAWLMFLGDPRDWFHVKSPSGEHYSVPRTGSVSGVGNFSSAYFAIRRRLPTEITKHLLDTFRPDPSDPRGRNFRDYYRDLKERARPRTLVDPKVDQPRGYTWGVPKLPDAPPEDLRSTSYSAEDTAIAHLQIYFTRMYDEMKRSEGFFSKIIANHMLQ